jgi:hypothetical protein
VKEALARMPLEELASRLLGTYRPSDRFAGGA